MMQFATPAMLWGLTGLLIPIGIHLLSRKQGKVIRIGSLRHLEETATQQFKGIRLNEVALLLLRCIVLVLLVLYLSGLSVKPFYSFAAKWVLIEPGLENNRVVKRWVDSLETNSYEVRYFQSGFPTEADSIEQDTDYYSLLEELKGHQFSDAIIFASNKPSYFTGLQPVSPANVRWISFSKEPHEFTAFSLSVDETKQLVRKGYSSTTATHFENSFQVADKTQHVDTSIIYIHTAASYDYDQQIITTALEAASVTLSRPISILPYSKKQIADSGSWLIWLSNEPIPPHPNTLSIEVSNSNQLLEKLSPSKWVITKRLNAEVALTDHLTLTLAQLLFDTHALRKIISEHDVRSLPDSLAFNYTAAKELSPTAYIKADTYLLSLFLLMLCIERIVSYLKKQ